MTELMTSRGIKISPADPEETPGRAATLTLVSGGESLLSTRDEGAQKPPLIQVTSAQNHYKKITSHNKREMEVFLIKKIACAVREDLKSRSRVIKK